MQLSHHDLSNVLAAVDILTSDPDPATLPSRTNDAVKSLVSTDVLSFEAFGTDNDYQGPLWYTPDGTVAMDLLRVMARLVHQQPFYEDLVHNRSLAAVRITDYVSITEYKKTAIYNEFFRHIHTDRQIVATLSVNPALMVSVSLCRMGKEFADRDCHVLDLLKPHLVSAFRTAQFINRSRFEAEQLQVALEATRFGVVLLDRYFQTQIENPIAVRLFRKYFPADPSAVPDELKRYLKYHLQRFHGDDYYLPPAPMEVCLGNSRLVIRLSFHAGTKTTAVLLEEINFSSAFDSAGSKITEREATVLFWVSQGKTDAEIALLLSISVRTVQKHVQHIFDKLGVETRTAATACFLQK
ncbi:MAG: LuxR C-terminal-related transcriptional regulator [Acidobacteriota bacterium]